MNSSTMNREALVDPNLHSGQPSPQDLSKEDEGANYLRRLRSAGPVETPSPHGGPNPGVPALPGGHDRRQSPRFRCSGSAEFRTAGSNARMWGTITDVSLHGCYVEMNSTFAVGTKVSLVLKSCGVQIETSGIVRTSYPSLGMGISFAEMDVAQLQALKQLLATLTGHIHACGTAVSADRRSKDESIATNALASADPLAMLDEIRDFFQKNQLLSRNEFHQIAKRVRRA